MTRYAYAVLELADFESLGKVLPPTAGRDESDGNGNGNVQQKRTRLGFDRTRGRGIRRMHLF